MKGSETRHSKQCECHVDGGPGGRGEEKVKDHIRAGKKGEEY